MNRYQIKKTIKRPYPEFKALNQNKELQSIYSRMMQKKQLLSSTIKLIQKESISQSEQLKLQTDELVYYLKLYNLKTTDFQELYKRYQKANDNKRQINENMNVLREKGLKMKQIERKAKHEKFQKQKEERRMKQQKILDLILQQNQYIYELKQKIQNKKDKQAKINQNLINVQEKILNKSNQIETVVHNFKQMRKNTCFFRQMTDNLYQAKKHLNNKLQEIKGNIRVYCRIRPANNNQEILNYEVKQDLLYIKRNLKKQQSLNLQTDFQFVFDHIFDQQVTQIQVFNEISQLVQSSIDGKNVCIFAYGQTGSGKTFTMQGKSDNTDIMGIIPRSINLIFEELNKYEQKNWKIQTMLSINQIYLENCLNLLQKDKLKIKQLTFKLVKDKIELEELLEKALKNRSVAFTQCNAQSSRSHLMIIIKLVCEKENETQQSSLVLVDLAGSQRVNQSNVSNQGLKQAQFINKSLTELGQMIRSLKECDKGNKTSFRNSKLTYLLQPYLQKGSKALMFVNISPLVKDQSQSLNSLKFASVARSCKVNKD